MKIGIGESDITPTFPCPLAGFGLARKEPHTGVHDPIGIRCALFEAHGEFIALLSCEVIGLKAHLQEEIRNAIPSSLGVPADRIVITCTHTHGAPVIDGEFVEVLIAGAVKAISLAHKDLRERTLHAGIAAHEEWVGFNRRELETGFLPVDREIPFMMVSELDGKLRALLFHYACHPSILGPDNLLITADWPGFTRRILQQNLGADVSILYLKGTEGNINTGYSAGISSLGVKIPTRTYTTAERAGGVIAKSLLAARDAAKPIAAPEIRFRSQMVDLKYRSVDGLDEARRNLAWWEEEVARIAAQNRPAPHLLSARVECAYAKFNVSALEQIIAEAREFVPCRQIAFAIGDLGFVNFPGEFFVEHGLQTKAEARSRITFPLGVTNDYLGYFPTSVAYANGGYEVACTRFAPTAADDWTRKGIALLNTICG
jgi:neutral ceramidase